MPLRVVRVAILAVSWGVGFDGVNRAPSAGGSRRPEHALPGPQWERVGGGARALFSQLRGRWRSAARAQRRDAQREADGSLIPAELTITKAMVAGQAMIVASIVDLRPVLLLQEVCARDWGVTRSMSLEA